MDPFNKLPVEITLSIMENIYSHTTIWRLVQASPTMLSHYSANKPALLRIFISKLIHAGNNDDLLQDALGILGFDATKTDDRATRRHFDRYTAKELPNPLDLPENKRDDATTANLFRLFSRLGLFIEDYMQKATSSCPVEAYLRHPPEIVYTNANKTVTLDDLSPLERYRLFRAFLKYEVLCKIFDPRLADMSDIEWKKKSDALWKHMDHRLYESIHCVNEYIEASFGGLFARLAWGQKHHPPSCFERSKTKGLLYPDTMTVYPLDYLHDLLRVPSDSYFYTDKWSEDRGFDVLTHLLSHMDKSPEENPTLLQWLCSISVEYPYYSRGDIWGDFLYNERQLIPIPSEPRGGLSLRLANKFYGNEDPNDQVEDAAVFSNTRHNGSEHYQSMIYRQRAWMFCDSAPLYPPIDEHFPAKTILRRYKDEADMFAHEERGRRRSVEWQDYYTGRTLEEPPPFDGVVNKERFPDNNVRRVPPFFNSNAEGKLSTFWRFEDYP